MLWPASDSLGLPLGILESVRRNSGEVGIVNGKTLSYVLSLCSCFGKTHVENYSRAVGFINSINHMLHKAVSGRWTYWSCGSQSFLALILLDCFSLFLVYKHILIFLCACLLGLVEGQQVHNVRCSGTYLCVCMCVLERSWCLVVCVWSTLTTSVPDTSTTHTHPSSIFSSRVIVCWVSFFPFCMHLYFNISV